MRIAYVVLSVVAIAALVLASQVVVDMLLEEEATGLADLQEFIGKPIRLQVEPMYHQEERDVAAAREGHPVLRQLGGIAALLLAIISVCAVLFTLLAATTGGSFKLDTPEASLVFSFSMIAVFGFLLVRMTARQINTEKNLMRSWVFLILRKDLKLH